MSSIDPSIDEPMYELMALVQVSFILTHEVGHALIRDLDLPALGQSECEQQDLLHRIILH